MEGLIDSTRFAFIGYDGPKLPDGTGVRELIRLRAMRDVATAKKERRQRIGHRRPTENQIPFYATTQSRHRFRQVPKLVEGVPQLITPPASTAMLDCLRISEHLSILHLAPLVGLRVGNSAISCFTKNPTRLAAAPGSVKLLSWIVIRYGNDTTIGNAVNCVISKVRYMINRANKLPTTYNSMINRHNAAMKSVQSDLCNGRWMSTDTLCAVQLLGMFDILDEITYNESWLYHVAGAAKMIKLRGPASFVSDFDLAALVALVGPIVTQAILENSNCFLADPRWEMVVSRAIRQDTYYADYADIVVCLWTHLVWGPNHFKAVTDLIYAAEPPAAQAIEDVMERLHRHRGGLAHLQAALTTRRSKYAVDFNTRRTMERIDGQEIEATWAVCNLITCRLIFSLCPARYRELEEESQRLARHVMDIRRVQDNCAVSKVKRELFISETRWIALATIQTQQAWLQVEDSALSRIFLTRRRFGLWCYQIGRKTSTQKEAIG